MPQPEQWLKLILLGSRMMEGRLIKRMAIHVAVLVILAILVGAMLATLLVIGLYAAYQLLLQHGVGMDEALLITAGVAASLLLAFALIGVHHFRRVAGKLSLQPAMAAKVGAAAEAFIDGLLATPVPKN